MNQKILLNLFPGGKQKALTLSYDDGQAQDRRLVALFNKYNLKATFHLNSGRVHDVFPARRLKRSSTDTRFPFTQ
jgi:peptidoglycan/xylan/chitin deacetylase (PgdA/CDA1 family)